MVASYWTERSMDEIFMKLRVEAKFRPCTRSDVLLPMREQTQE